MRYIIRMLLLINMYLLFVINSSSAQIKIGLIGGVNYSNLINFNRYGIIRTEPSPSQIDINKYGKTLKPGLILSFIIDYPISENISILTQPGLVIKKTSSNYESPAINVTDSYYSINVPLFVKYTPMRFFAFDPFLNVGLGIEHLIKATNKIGINQENEETNNYYKNNLFLLMGIGTDYSLGQSISLTIRLYYSYGLTNYSSNSPDFIRTSDIFVVTGLLYKL